MPPPPPLPPCRTGEGPGTAPREDDGSCSTHTQTHTHTHAVESHVQTNARGVCVYIYIPVLQSGVDHHVRGCLVSEGLLQAGNALLHLSYLCLCLHAGRGEKSLGSVGIVFLT